MAVELWNDSSTNAASSVIAVDLTLELGEKPLYSACNSILTELLLPAALVHCPRHANT